MEDIKLYRLFCENIELIETEVGLRVSASEYLDEKRMGFLSAKLPRMHLMLPNGEYSYSARRLPLSSKSASMFPVALLYG